MGVVVVVEPHRSPGTQGRTGPPPMLVQEVQEVEEMAAMMPVQTAPTNLVVVAAAAKMGAAAMVATES
tara:strand:+ start:328 stop:531 length:204 start_codon:yes stop_codon:yes gene_type:complete